MNPLVDTAWLAEHLNDSDLRVIDASWFFPTSGKKGRTEYEAAHIPGAVFFDIDEIKDEVDPAPHMVANSVKFASRVRHLGIGNGHRIVVYDRAFGSSAAARVWWNFRLYGHDAIALLDGGFTKWQAENRPVDNKPPLWPESHFLAEEQHPALLRSKEQMLSNLGSRQEFVLDARSAGRFQGVEAEPWPHIKVGHIPGSGNLPWTELLDPETKTFLPADILRAKFAKAGVDDRPIVTSCGSGVTASMLAFGLYLTGREHVAVYDGSWAEWGLAEDTPAEQG